MKVLKAKKSRVQEVVRTEDSQGETKWDNIEDALCKGYLQKNYKDYKKESRGGNRWGSYIIFIRKKNDGFFYFFQIFIRLFLLMDSIWWYCDWNPSRGHDKKKNI